MPEDRRKDIPAEQADADDRTGTAMPPEIDEVIEPPEEAQDVSPEEMRRLEAADGG